MPEHERITLYAAVDSPFPHRVRLALEEAGATYDIIWIDLIVNKPDWYEKKVYPGVGKVPYLVYGGLELHPDESPSPDTLQVRESTVILEFLADLFPDSHLLPASLALRVKARLFIHSVETKFLPAFIKFFFLGAPPDDMYAILEVLQNMLPPEGGYAVGEWSIADATLTPLLMRLVANLKTMPPPTMKEGSAQDVLETLRSPRFARMKKYLDDNIARPSMARTWDEEAVMKVWKQRVDRIVKTGKVTSDLTLPLPLQK